MFHRVSPWDIKLSFHCRIFLYFLFTDARRHIQLFTSSSMSAKPKHVRRLSLFGLVSSQPALSAGELTPRANANTNSVLFPLSADVDVYKRRSDQKPVQNNMQQAPITRKLSKRRKAKPLPDPPPSSLPNPSYTSFTSSNVNGSEEKNHSSGTLHRKRSLNIRVALSTIFVPKPSHKKVTGFLDGIEGIAGGKGVGGTKVDEEKSYTYISRSPSPPSPEIRPPSGLGQIASSIDLSTYAQEEYEASIRALSLSRSASRDPSVITPINRLPSDEATVNGSMTGSPLKSLRTCDGVEDLSFDSQPTVPSSPPSRSLIEIMQLTMPYCSHLSLSSLSRSCKAFLKDSQIALYENIDSDNLHDSEKRRKRILRTLASNAEISSYVRKFRWICAKVPNSPSPSTLSPKRTIPRRAPTISINSSPEEYILPRVLTSIPNVECLDLVHPHSTLLMAFFPLRQPQRKSPNVSPIPTPTPTPPQPPSLTKLKSLTLSGRTTLSSSFGALLVRFLELHPGIRSLSLPDVFHLPITSSNPSPPSSSRSSPSPTENIPPVPPLPPSLSIHIPKPQNVAQITPLLPSLEHLTAPLSLVVQLVPGRPLKTVDAEITTSMYEGLRPIEIAKSLAAAENPTLKDPVSPAKSWKTAREARRAGLTMREKTIREFRMRCTAKVDTRTMGRILNALGSEVGNILEALTIGWSGSENVRT